MAVKKKKYDNEKAAKLMKIPINWAMCRSAYGENFNKPSMRIVLRATNMDDYLHLDGGHLVGYRGNRFSSFCLDAAETLSLWPAGGFRPQGAVALGVGRRSPEPRTSFLLGATQTPVKSTPPVHHKKCRKCGKILFSSDHH